MKPVFRAMTVLVLQEPALIDFVSWKTQGSCQSPLAFQLSSRTSQTHHLNPFISHTESESYMYHTTVGPLFTCLVELPFFKGLVKSHPNCGGRKNKRKATSTGRRLNPNCTTIAFTAFMNPQPAPCKLFLKIRSKDSEEILK